MRLLFVLFSFTIARWCVSEGSRARGSHCYLCIHPDPQYGHLRQLPVRASFIIKLVKDETFCLARPCGGLSSHYLSRDDDDDGCPFAWGGTLLRAYNRCLPDTFPDIFSWQNKDNSQKFQFQWSSVQRIDLAGLWHAWRFSFRISSLHQLASHGE